MVSLPLIIAESSAETHHANPLLPETNELIWGFICFALLMATVGPMVFPRIQAMLEQRTQTIEGNLIAAEQARKEAEALRAQRQQQLEDAHLESQKILDQARGNADRLEDELRARAEDQARRIVERANESIYQERDRVAVELRQQVGGFAVDIAERVVGDALDKNAQLKLVDKYIDDLVAAK